ncbi:MAG TPA: hypothetical protein DGO43_07740 [Chloroflexi bacterium]|nr:hypothetical protein [Chloroflexota bacterium]
MSTLGRRRFVMGSTALIGGATVVACAAPERESQVQSFVLQPEQSLPGQELWFATACAHTSCGNSVVVRTIDGRAKKVEGNPAFPVNQGKLNVRSQSGVQSLYHPDRLDTPKKRRGLRGAGTFNNLEWATALDLLAEKLSDASSVTIITGPISGTRARIAQDFAGAFAGEHLVYETIESSVWRQVAKAGLGVDRLPHLDIANAHSILSFGADFLSTWISPTQYSIGYGEFRQGAGERGRLIQVEPRMSTTGANADSWVYVHPGQEGALALSIAQVIAAEGLTGNDNWFDAVNAVGGLDALNAYAPDLVAERTGVPASRIQEIAREFASHQPGLAIAGGPALASANGLDNGLAVILLNRMVGSVGRVGGLLPNPGPRTGITPPVVPTTFEALASRANAWLDGDSPDVAIVFDADPVYGMPEATRFADALGSIPFVVGIGTAMSETLGHADLVLPATHAFEEWGDFAPDPMPGQQVAGYQQPVITPFVTGRSFGDVLLTAWHEVKPETAPTWETMRDAVRAGAEQSFGGSGDFEARWIDLLKNGGAWNTAHGGSFSPSQDWNINLLAEPQFSGDEIEFPMHLVPFESVALGTGDESANPWMQATPDPITSTTWTTWVEVNPKTAAALGVTRGDVVEIRTLHGKFEATVYESPVSAPGIIGVPIGQGHRFGGRWREDRGANVLAALAPLTVAGAGGLAWAATRAAVTPTNNFKQLPTIEVVPNARNDSEEPVVQISHE